MKSKRIENIIKDVLKEKIVGGSTMSLSQLEAMDTDGDYFFTIETVLDAFKMGIEIGCQSVGSLTNKNSVDLVNYFKEEEEC